MTTSTAEPDDKDPSLGSPGNLAKRIQATADKQKAANRERKKQELLLNPQLTLWVEAVRGAPNELLRTALFSAKNRKTPRRNLRSASLAVIGDGEVIFTGQELRQDDETVWLQLVHLARSNGIAQRFEFTPYSFCKSIGWPTTGQSYDRLDDCMTRLQATSLRIRSKRLGDAVSMSMLPVFTSNRKRAADESARPWIAGLHNELVLLFADFQYTRIDWQRRLELPEGLATWLHAYYASHRDPFPVNAETLWKGSGLADDADVNPPRDEAPEARKDRLQRQRNFLKTLKAALDSLKKIGFLELYEISKKGLVTVKRAPVQF